MSDRFRLSTLGSRAYWWGARAKGWREKALRALSPARMRVVHYSWPLLPEVCPCDVHLCELIEARGIRRQAIFHFGTGGHHVVGMQNRARGWDNDVVAITASPSEHAAYVRAVIRDPLLGARYRVLFGDVYNLSAASLPTFDLVTMFHLCEFAEPPSDRRRLDDAGVLALLLGKLSPGGRALFYEGSSAYRQARPLIEGAAAAGRLTLEERYKTLTVYRVGP